MNRLLSCLLVSTLLLQPFALLAQHVDTGIVDYVDSTGMQKKITQTPIMMDYKSFSSCDEMNTTLTTYAQSLVDAGLYNPQPQVYYG